MGAINKEELLRDAGLIRNANTANFNSAERVGKMLVDIINSLDGSMIQEENARDAAIRQITNLLNDYVRHGEVGSVSNTMLVDGSITKAKLSQALIEYITGLGNVAFGYKIFATIGKTAYLSDDGRSGGVVMLKFIDNYTGEEKQKVFTGLDRYDLMYSLLDALESWNEWADVKEQFGIIGCSVVEDTEDPNIGCLAISSNISTFEMWADCVFDNVSVNGYEFSYNPSQQQWIDKRRNTNCIYVEMYENKIYRFSTENGVYGEYIPIGGSESITIDDTLGDSSNPVANRAINAAIASLSSSLDGKESTSNRVTIVNQQSDDNHYPTAKSVYTIVHAVQNALSRVAGDVANNASDIASLVMEISGKQDKLADGDNGQVLTILDASGSIGWADSFMMQQDRARSLISNIKRNYRGQNVNPQFISDKITELIMNGQYDPLFDFSGDGAVINSSDAAVFGGFSYLMAIDEINRITDTLAGYMQKMQSAIGGMVVVSKDDGTVEESGRTVDELMDVLFGYLISATIYNYRWKFEFNSSIYSPNHGSFSVEASIRIRNTTYDIPVTANYGDWDMPQAFAESIVEGIRNIDGLDAEVESYTSEECLVIIHSLQEISIMSDIFLYSTVNDNIAMCMVGDAHPWISSREVATLSPTERERGFYVLNDPSSDRYEDSENKVYYDRITHSAYTFHDDGYHLLKAEPKQDIFDLTSVFTQSNGANFTDSTLDAYFEAIQSGQAFGYVTKQVTFGTQTANIKVPVMLTVRGSWSIALYYDYTEFNGSMKRIERTLQRSGSSWTVADAWDKQFIS